MVCRNFILPEFCKPCLFLSSFIFAQLILPYPKRKDTPFGVSFRFRLPKTLLEKSLAELSRPQTTEGKEAPSFPATRASEMTPFMTDRATFLQESSPVRHAFLGRKRPEAFFGKLRPDQGPRGGAALLRRWRKPLAQSEFTSPEHLK